MRPRPKDVLSHRTDPGPAAASETPNHDHVINRNALVDITVWHPPDDPEPLFLVKADRRRVRGRYRKVQLGDPLAARKLHDMAHQFCPVPRIGCLA